MLIETLADVKECLKLFGTAMERIFKLTSADFAAGASEKLLRSKGFRQVIVCAEVQSALDIGGGISVCCDNDGRNIFRLHVIAQQTQDLKTIQAWHSDVE